MLGFFILWVLLIAKLLLILVTTKSLLIEYLSSRNCNIFRPDELFRLQNGIHADFANRCELTFSFSEILSINWAQFFVPFPCLQASHPWIFVKFVFNLCLRFLSQLFLLTVLLEFSKIRHFCRWPYCTISVERWNCRWQKKMKERLLDILTFRPLRFGVFDFFITPAVFIREWAFPSMGM